MIKKSLKDLFKKAITLPSKEIIDHKREDKIYMKLQYNLQKKSKLITIFIIIVTNLMFF